MDRSADGTPRQNCGDEPDNRRRNTLGPLRRHQPARSGNSSITSSRYSGCTRTPNPTTKHRTCTTPVAEAQAPTPKPAAPPGGTGHPTAEDGMADQASSNYGYQSVTIGVFGDIALEVAADVPFNVVKEERADNKTDA